MREHVAEFTYRPGKCQKAYRVVVVWKELEVYKGQQRLFDKARCFFYITNIEDKPAEDIVFSANDRCNQENLHAQLKSDVRSLTAPVDSLLSNWAYMVMASLAWSLKAWSALILPEEGRWKEKHREEKRKLLRMEFATFRQAMMNIPAQIVRTGRQDRLPLVELESVAARILPPVGSTESPLAMLSRASMKPESGCSGPPPRQTALSATEPEMKHDTTRRLPPTLMALAAGGVDLPSRRKTATKAFGLRLFKD